MTPELSQAIGKAAEEQGTTPETLAAEALRERFGHPGSGEAVPRSRTLADRLAPHLAALENVEPRGVARVSERREEYAQLLMQDHLHGRP
jgi:hypothetical protein